MTGYGPWSLRRRLNVLFGWLGALLLVVGILGVLAFGTLTAAMRAQADELSPARVAAGRMVAGLLNQETGARGYALTGQQDYLEPYTDGRRDQLATEAELRRLLAGKPDLLADVAEVRTRADRWYASYAEASVAAVRSGGPSPAARDRIVAGKTAFDDIRVAATILEDDLTAARDVARDDMVRALWRLGVLVAVSGMALVVTALVLIVALRRWVTGPLDHLGAEVRKVVSGNLDYAVPTGGPPEVASLAADVDSMRRRIVDELAEAVTAREQIQAQAAQLTTQAEDLRRSNRELEQFAYVASHDLQEPLRKVTSFCQMLQRRYSGQLDDRADQYIEFAVDGAKRMQRLINDLLAFSRVGRTTESFVPVDCGEAFRAALASLELARAEADADVTAGELPVVPGDLSLLTTLFQNLIGNGIKFRGEEPPRVRVEARRSGEEWLFSCRDNGIGIEPEYADRIFVIFQRLHGKDAYSGTGIGLAMCKKIVEYHGGRIWLDRAGEPDPALTEATAPADGVATEPAGAGAAEPDPAGAADAPPTGAGGAAPDRTPDERGTILWWTLPVLQPASPAADPAPAPAAEPAPAPAPAPRPAAAVSGD